MHLFPLNQFRTTVVNISSSSRCTGDTCTLLSISFGNANVCSLTWKAYNCGRPAQSDTSFVVEKAYSIPPERSHCSPHKKCLRLSILLQYWISPCKWLSVKTESDLEQQGKTQPLCKSDVTDAVENIMLMIFFRAVFQIKNENVST